MIYVLVALTIAWLINTYALIVYASDYSLKVWKACNLAMALGLCSLAYLWVVYFK